jgi:hypothetical protein
VAMTDEELMLQLEILTSKTESNPNMVYKANAALNKALNPSFFSGNATKIVNAINDLAVKTDQSIVIAKTVAQKVNDILLDVDTADNAVIWENVKELMGKETIIEGIEEILKGNRVDNILGISSADYGKVLSVDVNNEGRAIVNAVNVGDIINAYSIGYMNYSYPSLSNVSDALDYILNNMENGGGYDGGYDEQIFWDMIIGRPFVPDNLNIEDGKLQLREGSRPISEIPLATDEDIEAILNE